MVRGVLLTSAALIFFLLSVPVGLTALAAGAGLLQLPYELYLIKQRIPMLFACHMLASGLALLLLPAVFASAGRTVHRHLGRITAALVLAGGLTALPVAAASVASPAARAGFFVQGLAWLVLDGLAFAAIRQGDAARHRALMLAMAAVASGAIWLRFATVAATRMELPFVPVYAVAAWACWLTPLAAAWVIERRRGEGRRGTANGHE